MLDHSGCTFVAIWLLYKRCENCVNLRSCRVSCISTLLAESWHQTLSHLACFPPTNSLLHPNNIPSVCGRHVQISLGLRGCALHSLTGVKWGYKAGVNSPSVSFALLRSSPSWCLHWIILCIAHIRTRGEYNSNTPTLILLQLYTWCLHILKQMLVLL